MVPLVGPKKALVLEVVLVVIFPEFYRRYYSVCHDECISELLRFCWSSSNALRSSPRKMLLQGTLQTKFFSEG